jgi:hypothetical protein
LIFDDFWHSTDVVRGQVLTPPSSLNLSGGESFSAAVDNNISKLISGDIKQNIGISLKTTINSPVTEIMDYQNMPHAINECVDASIPSLKTWYKIEDTVQYITDEFYIAAQRPKISVASRPTVLFAYIYE